MSYTNKILKTYFWQFASNGLRFLSMFVVAPFLAGNPVDYGLYMICLSVMVFFTFADFGFLTAGMKFIAEYVGKKDVHKETDVIGFSLFINMIFALLFMLIFVAFVVHPEWLIKDLGTPEQFHTARKLLFVLLASVPFKIIERSCAMILSARVQIYIMRRLNMAASFITICSVYLFFSRGNYDIVGYYAFSVAMEIVALFFTVKAIGDTVGLRYLTIVRKIKFDAATFKLMKNLAASSLYTNFVVLLFSHIDLLFISKTVGAVGAATYGIALNLLNYFETFIGSNGMCGPFLARFNHIVGTGNIEQLKGYFFRVVTVLLAVVVLPIVCLSGLMSPFIHCWVGESYNESVRLASILLFGLILHHLSMPSNYVLNAQNKAGILAASTTLTLLVYWGGVILFMPRIGIVALPVAKASAYIISGIYRTVVATRIMSVNAQKIILQTVLPTIAAGCVGYILSSNVADYLPMEKNKGNLLLVMVVYALTTSALFVVYAIVNPKVKKEYGDVVKTIIGKNRLMK